MKPIIIMTKDWVLIYLERKIIMFVCICNAITDRQIQDSVASGAASLTDLKDQLGVASCCGCCADLASSFLTTVNQQPSATIVSASVVVEH